MKNTVNLVALLLKIIWAALREYAKTPQGAEALQQLLDAAEMLTGRDFDGDGDIGVAGARGISGDPGPKTAVDYRKAGKR